MASRKKQWCQAEEQLLFKLHAQYGNRWSVIAAQMATKDDSAIKNKFYSTLRKGLRKINRYIVEIKKKRDPVRLKGYKTLQEIFITKLIAVVDNNFQEKCEVKHKALELCSDIQHRVIEIACNGREYFKQQQFTDYSQEEALLTDIQEFNKNCKKRKGKRKNKEDHLSSSQDEEQDVSEEIHQVKQDKEDKAKIQKEKNNITHSHNQTNQHTEINQNSAQGLFLLPHTKQNIILSAQLNSEPETQPKLKLCASNPHHDKKEDNKDSQKKDSYSNTIYNSFNFTTKPEDIQLAPEQNNNQSSTTFNMTNSWFFQSISSKELSKKFSGYMTHASPLASDSNNPFTFASLMQNNNFINSSMYESKNNADLLSSNKFYQNKQEEGTLSLLDHLPVFISNSLVRSADLQQSTDLLAKSIELKQKSSGMQLQSNLNGPIANLFPIHNISYRPIENIAHLYNFADENSLKNEISKGVMNKLVETNTHQQELKNEE